jgi:hypothetical protein
MSTFDELLPPLEFIDEDELQTFEGWMKFQVPIETPRRGTHDVAGGILKMLADPEKPHGRSDA